MIHLNRKGKCGEGAYGVVYEAKLTTQKDSGTKVEKVAVKRNYGDNITKGVSCLREMNFLASLNHPCVIRLKSISVGDPFENEKPWTPKPKRHKMKEDSHHFVMEYSEYDLDSFSEKCKNYHQLKTIMCQLLLGMEFFHSKGVLHRDIKPPNVLVSMENNIPYAKYCDFGLSCVPNIYRPSTPGAVTSWYRAPEICCEYSDYSFPSDVWSLGCVFYEIITKLPFVQTKKDDDKMIFDDIIDAHPKKFTLEEVESFIKKGRAKFKSEIPSRKKESLMDRIKTKINVRDFNKKGGTINQFVDLLEKMLEFDPSKRLTPSECISHPFFCSFEKYFLDMRKKYPPKKDLNINVTIIDCLERRWMVNTLFSIYNKRKKYKWYSHDILFQSMRLFDEYLNYAYSQPDVKLREDISETQGKLNSKTEVELYTYTCIYIMYKHYSTLYKIYPWTSIFPNLMISDENLKIVEDFEKYVIRKITKYVIFKPTFIDILSNENVRDESKELTIKNFFVNYGMVKSFDGKLKTLYSDIKNFLDSQNNTSK